MATRRPVIRVNFSELLALLIGGFAGHLLFTSGKDWFLEYPVGSGKMEFLHYQLRKGCAKTPLRCMRIYFWWDDAGKIVVVGHLPGYIEKGGS